MNPRALDVRPVFAIALAFGAVAGLAAAPAVWPGSPLAMIAEIVFGGLCHQREDRSFVHLGQAMAVCHRCSGIYLGLGLGALLTFVMPLEPRRWRPWLLGAAPLAAQVALAWIWPTLDVWWLRFGTGLVAGAAGGWILASVFGRRAHPTSTDLSAPDPTTTAS